MAATLPLAVVRHLDAQMADLGTPAFVDGLAGLLILYAGRDPQRASAIGRWVLARAQDAGVQVAEALQLAGFDPAVAGFSAHTPTAQHDPLLGTDREAVPAQPGGALAATSHSAASRPATSHGSRGIGAAGSGPLNLSAVLTARPGMVDLATPQLR